jgi:hypothetical protein
VTNGPLPLDLVIGTVLHPVIDPLVAETNLVVGKGNGGYGLAVVVGELDLVGMVGSVEDVDDGTDGACRKVVVWQVHQEFDDVIELHGMTSLGEGDGDQARC